MEILITGACGFVGSNLLKYLKRNTNYTIYGLDIDPNESLMYDGFYSWKELEIISWNNLDAIIHLAGKAHDTKNVASECEYYHVNVELTKEVFHHFKNSQAGTFIFFSSVKAATDKALNTLFESFVPNPNTIYGKTKLEAEQYILKFSQGKRVVVFRPSMIHGPGNKGNLNLLYNYAKLGFPYPFGKFVNQRSFTSIENINFIVQKVLESKDVQTGVYNIADDETLSTECIFRAINQSLNKKGVIWNIPLQIITIFGKLSDLLHLPISSERIEKMTESYVVSNYKIKHALGVNSLPVAAIDGMISTLRSFGSEND